MVNIYSNFWVLIREYNFKREEREEIKWLVFFLIFWNFGKKQAGI